MSKDNNQGVVKSLIDELRNYINAQVNKLNKYIQECEKGQSLLSDELLGMLYFSILYLERAKLYVSGLKFWYENYQNTKTFVKYMNEECTVDQWCKFCMYEINTSSLGIHYSFL